MSNNYQARIQIAFHSEPNTESLVGIVEVMFKTSSAETPQIIEPRKVGDMWLCDYPVQWNVSTTFDEEKFLNELHAVDHDIAAVISIDMATMYASYSCSRSRATNEYWTRVILSRFVNDMINSTMGSFDDIVPFSQLPTVVFN